MKSKMVGLFVIVIIALMVAGFAYAHWTETLTLTGTVNTGSLDLEWSCTCNDNDEPPLKDVGEVDCKIEDDTLTITVTKAYPCYTVSGTIDITNKGTVPAVLKKYKMDLPADVTYSYDPNTGKITIYYKGEVAAEGSIKFRGDPLTQIHDAAYIDFTIHFTNPGLPEDWSGTFTITLDFENWSPSPTA